jgi:hypothetical protein
VYFHLIGTEPHYQNKGVSTKLKQYALRNMPAIHANKEKYVCIRINNLPSIKVNMRALGVCLTSLKPIDRSMIGSRETNFNATSSSDYFPILDPSIIKTREVFVDINQIPNSSKFLIPVKNGEESDLKNTNTKKLLQKAFENGYIVTGLFRAQELNISGDSYFYCSR